MLDQSGDAKVDEVERAPYHGICMDNGSYAPDNDQNFVEACRLLGFIFYAVGLSCSITVRTRQ